MVKTPNTSALLLVLSMALWACSSQPQIRWSETKQQGQAHMRGVQYVNDSVMWASGTQGTVLRSTDGGKNWEVKRVPGADSLDFRDIHAIDDKKAWVISAGSPGRIYRTTDGGQVWYLLYNNNKPEIFMDGMDGHGDSIVVYGDPMDGPLLFLRSNNGKSWERINHPRLKPLENEAGFAASGTGIALRGEKIYFATGGASYCRMFVSHNWGSNWDQYPIPLRSAEGAGVFSICLGPENTVLAAGGDYRDSTRNDSNLAISYNGGKQWKLLPQSLGGYRSCIQAGQVNGKVFYMACGRSGIDLSWDGEQWEKISSEGFYALSINGNKGLLVGRSGKIKSFVME